MAQVITRPGEDNISPDLKAEYDRVDQWWTGQLQLIEQILRGMSRGGPGSASCDFNAMRYEAMKRLCLTMANDIHRDLSRSQFKRVNSVEGSNYEAMLELMIRDLTPPICGENPVDPSRPRSLARRALEQAHEKVRFWLKST